jgi:putative transposase
MDKFKNKYRIPSARAPWWDYGWAGAYFITICTQNREHYFGEIHNGVMRLSHLGVLADVLWHEIPHHFKNVELGAFVVMPNHIHGILILHHDHTREMNKSENIANNENNNMNDIPDMNDIPVETRHALSLREIPEIRQTNENNVTNQSKKSIAQKRFQNQGKNTISSIIGSYKSAVTKYANRLGLPNGWQSRFHDHIIRNDAEYQRISKYIQNNPKNWQYDKLYGYTNK